MRHMWICALLALAGCTTDDKGIDTDLGGPAGDADADIDADTDTDTDTDADVDADVDADTDTDVTDTGTASGLDCTADYTGQTPNPGAGGAQCVTEIIQCGDELFHTNTGGRNDFDYDTWDSLSELQSLQRGDLAGDERVYLFEDLAYGDSVKVRVESCIDAWASWIVLGDLSEGTCDTTPWGPGGHFDGTFRDQTRDHPNAANGVVDVLFIVEGYQGAEGNFKLTVECN